MTINTAVDKVRASRDGHQYHEAWLARRALGLLLPRDGLCGIAVEGLSVEDQKGANASTIEIADATFYFGETSNIQHCDRIEIAQFKYAASTSAGNFSFSDAEKTIKKFSDTESKYLRDKKSAAQVSKVVYAIYTNMRISPALAEAVSALANGEIPNKQRARAQYDQLVGAVSLEPDQRRAFAAKLSLIGSGPNLHSIEGDNARLIADWSASDDATARARLGSLRQLVRGKAGVKGQNNNVITYIDVLAELDIGDIDQLLPTPQAFPEPGPVVEREQLTDFVQKLGASGLWLVHAAGGIGKTVFAQSAGRRLEVIDEVVIFDCFGGGAYRSPLDTRHRAERGLMHIVNELACRGLCDPILPGSTDPEEVARKSVQRFKQAIAAIRKTRPSSRLVVIMDAADNAAMEARDRGHLAFPRTLFEALSHLPAVEGLVCIATARSERRELAIGRSTVNEFSLASFSLDEAKAFIGARRPEATDTQIEALVRRANGNPRVIANLIEPDRMLSDSIEPQANLDELIAQRIQRAIKLTDEKGVARDQIAAFLCALSVLPPPVPLHEIATAFGISDSEVESFASDLAPLLERTRHGLIFRDEPTETLVRTRFGQNLSLLNDVATRLEAAQQRSVYAARSLPGLLFAMGRPAQLRTLAFDTRFPSELDSDIARRVIRLNRIRTAVAAAANSGDFDATVDLLVELAAVVIVDERGEDYVLANPDLVVGLGDPEALRRMFEARTGWPGTRHARLATAYTADGDLAEAFGHALRADDWQRWHERQDDAKVRDVSVTAQDRASVAFYLFAKNRMAIVARLIAYWKPRYGYSIAHYLFEFCTAAESFGNLSNLRSTLHKILAQKNTPSALVTAAFDVFPELVLDEAAPQALKRISDKLKNSEDTIEEFSSNRHEENYRRAMVRCVLRMVKLGMKSEVTRTLTFLFPERYGLWLLGDTWHTAEVAPHVLAIVTRCAVEERSPDLFDCLPKELWALVEADPKPPSIEDQQKLLGTRLSDLDLPKEKWTSEIEERITRSSLTNQDRRHASERLADRIPALLALVGFLHEIMKAKDAGSTINALNAFFAGWLEEQTPARRRGAYVRQEHMRFIEALYQICGAQVLTTLNLYSPTVAERLVSILGNSQWLAPETVINFVQQLAAHPENHSYAGAISKIAVGLIEREDDSQHRALLFARLARALLRASRMEASLLFKRGLKELDALGSGDYDFTQELLSFAGTLREKTISSQQALRLAKICEMNNYDSDKWPWPLTTKALLCASGGQSLSQLTRWHDRDKVDLRYTLPSALTFSIKYGKLHAETALPLMRLVDPQVMWDWGWHDLVEALSIANATPKLLGELLDQVELSFPNRIPSEYLSNLAKAINNRPEWPSEFTERLARLSMRNSTPRRVERHQSSPNHALKALVDTEAREKQRKAIIDRALEVVDPLNAASVEIFIESISEIEGWPYDKSDAFAALRERVSYQDRSKHVEAIADTEGLALYQKVSILSTIVDAWNEDSPTHMAVLATMADRLVNAHADELLGSSWRVGSDVIKLSRLTGVPIEDLTMKLVASAAKSDLVASAKCWLSCATLMATKADASTRQTSIARLLDGDAARLADVVGDGPWSSELDPGSDSDEIAAGLVWFCLGSPEASERWRAAHAVRSLAKHNQWSVIEKLAGKLSSVDAGAFQDRKLPFFQMNAQMWFLIAIARLALDFPDEIHKFKAILEEIIAETANPHAAIQQAAAAALRNSLAGRSDRDSKRLLKLLQKVNTSEFPIAKIRKTLGRYLPWDRPSEYPEPDPSFHLDYDFEKYKVSNLGDVFGLPKWRISDLCQQLVRSWAPTVDSMSTFSGKRQPYQRNGYYRPTEDSYQSHGAYLAWHALAVLGGQLLRKGPVTDCGYHDKPWEDWLADYCITRDDGYWIADGTASKPVAALHELRNGDGTEDDRDLPTNDVNVLKKLAGLEPEQPATAAIAVAGVWSSPDGVGVSITSALVDPEDADVAALAIATCPPFHMWLPTNESYDEDRVRAFRNDMHPCEPWITQYQRSESLDRRDPFASSAAMAVCRPSKAIIKASSLSTTDPWGFLWQDATGTAAFSYVPWGSWTNDDGEGENQETGYHLTCTRPFLSATLRKSNKRLLLLVKLQRYHKEKRKIVGEEDGHFTNSHAIFIIDDNLNLQVITPGADVRKAVEKLDHYSRFEFSARLTVIRAL